MLFRTIIIMTALTLTIGGCSLAPTPHQTQLLPTDRDTCVFRNLSYLYDYEISTYYDLTIDTRKEMPLVTGRIFSKKTKLVVDSFYFESIGYDKPICLDCQSYNSFFTNQSGGTYIGDNSFGAIVIADLNFDQREDLAIINSNGGNGGDCYNFYLQQAGGTFLENKYLRDSMSYFPFEIDRANQQLRVRYRMYNGRDEIKHFEWSQRGQDYQVVQESYEDY